jgi:hypothetical protein
VIGQSYAAEVGNQHVMAGNAALLTCQLPSFVADLVRVIGWVDDQANQYMPTTTYGNLLIPVSEPYFTWLVLN